MGDQESRNKISAGVEKERHFLATPPTPPGSEAGIGFYSFLSYLYSNDGGMCVGIRGRCGCLEKWEKRSSGEKSKMRIRLGIRESREF